MYDSDACRVSVTSSAIGGPGVRFSDGWFLVSALRHRSVGRASVCTLALAVVVALSILTQGLTSGADGSPLSGGQSSISQASSELGVVPATPRASFGKSDVEREDRTGFGPAALLIAGAAVFTLVPAHAPLPSVARPAVHGVVGLSVARAPPVTPAV